MPEIITKRTANSKTFDLGKGRRQLVVSIGDIHYRDNYADASEPWKDINLEWQQNRITKAPYELTRDGQKLTLKDKKTGEVSTIELLESKPAGLKWEIVPEYTRVCFRHILPSDKIPFEAKFKVTGKIPFRTKASDDEGEIELETTLKDGILTEKLSSVKDKEPGAVRPAKGNIRIDPTWQVGTGTDDCFRIIGDPDSWILDYASARAGSWYDPQRYLGCGMRFTNITIPQGRVILDGTHLTVRCSYYRDGTTVRTRVSAEAVNDAVTFADDKDVFDTRWANRTTARVDWDNVPAWALNSDHDSPEIKSVIQEIVDRGGWVSGQDIVIFWDDFEGRSSSSADRQAYSYDGSIEFAPKLVVIYTTAPTVSTDPATEVGQTTVVLNGTLDFDGGYACECGFEWGETTDYGTETPTQSKTTGETFSQTITGLAPNTTYHFRAIATNLLGTRYGADRSFQSWISETAVPFTITGQLFFSPIIGREVYVIDRGTNFWKYNLGTKQWTELASPNYTGSYAYRTLVPDSITNPTKLYCPSEHSFTGVDNRGDAMRISAYDIAGNSWTDSARIFPYILQLNVTDKTGFQTGEIVQGNSSGATAFITGIGVDSFTVVPQTDTRFTQAEEVEGQTSGATTDLWGGGHSFGSSPSWAYGGGQNIKSIVYKDATHIYCWQGMYGYHAVGQYYYSDARCVCYNPTADTWEAFSANSYQNPSYSLYMQHHRCAAINAAGTIIYSGGIYGYKYCKYTLATDTYAATAITSVITFSFAHIKNKLPYTTVSTMRQGYLDTADDSENDDKFTENMERDSGYGSYSGIADDLTVIIARAKSTAPELMSQGILSPAALSTVTTNPATEVGQTTATLNGTLDSDGGEACECSFEYGETTAYGSTTATQSKTTGETFSQEVRGLMSGRVYHFRAKATNSAGTSYGADRTFRTEALSAEAHQALGKGYALGRAGL